MNDYFPNEMMSRAFFIDEQCLSKGFNPNIPPSTAEEYLHRVISEASKLDKVVTAEIDPSKIRPPKTLEVLPGLEEASQSMIPTQDWQRCQVSDFSVVRDRLQRARAENNYEMTRIPGLNDESGWRKVCIGDKDHDAGSFETTAPLLSKLVSSNMTQRVLLKVLEYNVGWLADGFSVQQGKWLYALLACLEMPLYPETCSLLRELARECSRIRASLGSPDHEFLVHLNLLICLVAKYYRQLDLSD